MYQVNFLPWRQRRDRRRGCFWLGVLLLQVTVLLLAGGLSPANCVINRRSVRSGWRCWKKSWRQ